MLGDSININNMCCNPVGLKKICKASKKIFFWAQIVQKMGHAQNEKQFFLVQITNADYQLSETFYFIKISYVLAEL